MGLDLPFYVQFWLYLKGILSGDFGVSSVTGNLVLSDLLLVFPATFELASIAMLFGICLGVPLGCGKTRFNNCWFYKGLGAIRFRFFGWV